MSKFGVFWCASVLLLVALAVFALTIVVLTLESFSVFAQLSWSCQYRWSFFSFGCCLAVLAALTCFLACSGLYAGVNPERNVLVGLLVFSVGLAVSLSFLGAFSWTLGSFAEPCVVSAANELCGSYPTAWACNRRLHGESNLTLEMDPSVEHGRRLTTHDAATDFYEAFGQEALCDKLSRLCDSSGSDDVACVCDSASFGDPGSYCDEWPDEGTGAETCIVGEQVACGTITEGNGQRYSTGPCDGSLASRSDMVLSGWLELQVLCAFALLLGTMLLVTSACTCFLHRVAEDDDSDEDARPTNSRTPLE